MKKGTETVWQMKDRPVCGICEYVYGEMGVPAFYDGRIKGRSTWTNFCESCFEEYGSGLGTGLGQRLIFRDEPVK